MSNENIFESAGRLFFTRERVRSLEKELNMAGVNIPADSFAGYASINAVVVTIVLTMFLLLYQPTADMLTNGVNQLVDLPFPVIALLVLVISFISVYLATMALISSYVLMKAEDRRNKLEAVLPDFLSLVASNIKAGMTLDQAMWYSAKPEFGLLSVEVRSRIKSSFSGQSLASTLDQLGDRFDSRVFKRTLLLLKQASATGGELTTVLERTTEDVRNNLIMKKEIAASLVLYEIFVMFAAVVGAPFLFAVAAKLIEVFERMGPGGSIPSNVGGPFSMFSTFKFSGPTISSADFFWFSIPMIFVTALISSFIVSVIRSGSKSQGMKYFPFVLAAAYFIYWIVINAVESIFGMIA